MDETLLDFPFLVENKKSKWINERERIKEHKKRQRECLDLRIDSSVENYGRRSTRWFYYFVVNFCFLLSSNERRKEWSEHKFGAIVAISILGELNRYKVPPPTIHTGRIATAVEYCIFHFRQYTRERHTCTCICHSKFSFLVLLHSCKVQWQAAEAAAALTPSQTKTITRYNRIKIFNRFSWQNGTHATCHFECKNSMNLFLFMLIAKLDKLKKNKTYDGFKPDIK